MKTSNKIVTLGLIVASSFFSAKAADLNVTFTNIEHYQGNLIVAVYDSKLSFQDKGEPAKVASIPVTQSEVSYSLTDLPDGNYAIKLFHDENSNGKLDKNFLGVPKEGYGFSNNVGMFGTPPFEEATFGVSGDTKIKITVR